MAELGSPRLSIVVLANVGIACFAMQTIGSLGRQVLTARAR
jgi:hypothetical protein